MDPLEQILPEKKNTATHIMGSSRIDYILVEPSIMPHIRAFGLTAISDPFVSDHRATFMDLDFTSMFGEKLAPIVKGGKRMVTTKIDKRTPIFLRHVGVAMEKQRIIERCQNILKTAASVGPIESVGQSFALLDRDVRHILLKSEEKAGRNPGGKDWSSDLQVALLECRFWRTYLLKGIKNPKTVLAISKRLGWQEIPKVDEFEAKSRLLDALRKVKKFNSDDTYSRMKHLEECQKIAAAEGDIKKSKAIKRMIQAESTHRSYKKMRMTTKDSKSPGLAAVQVTEKDGSIKTISDPAEMTPLLVEAGRRHYSQANGTPFTVGPLADIEYTACCIQANNILNGCSSFASNPELDRETRNWISHAAFIRGQEDKLDHIDCWLTPDQVRKGYLVWDESTSTSPEGDHLGIYKALARKFDKKEDEDGSLRAIQDAMWEVIATIMNLGCTFGLTLPRWEKAVCVMIEKAPGNFLLKKLRRIFIMSSDYNLSLGIIMGRRLVWHAEQHALLNENTWGSRPERAAQDATLMKKLTGDTARLTNTPLATFDNDAKACCDRIIMKVALILARRLGLPPKTAEWMARTTAAMRNHIKTAYGISQETFVREHGPGQGN